MNVTSAVNSLASLAVEKHSFSVTVTVRLRVRVRVYRVSENHCCTINLRTIKSLDYRHTVQCGHHLCASVLL